MDTSVDNKWFVVMTMKMMMMLRLVITVVEVF